MARPRNEELHSRVTSTIVEQLLSQGISGVSYASIASACATTRAVVQDYYPRKSDMVEAVTARLNSIAMETTLPYCSRLAIRDKQALKVGHLFLAGSVFFEFMQRTTGRKTFFTELLRDRDQAETLLFSVMSNSFAEIEREDVVEDPAYRNDLIMSIGGFFELFYYHLKHQQHFDPAVYYGQMTRVWMIDAGFARDQVAEVLERCAIALDDLDAMVNRMEEQLEAAPQTQQ